MANEISIRQSRVEDLSDLRKIYACVNRRSLTVTKYHLVRFPHNDNSIINKEKKHPRQQKVCVRRKKGCKKTRAKEEKKKNILRGI